MINRYVEFPEWSIKVFKSNEVINTKYKGLKLSEHPSLQAKHVTDVKADFIADPFIISHNSNYYMFFEVMNRDSKRGEIGLAKSCDGENWNYEKIILKEDYHLSYPHVFKVGNQIYMIPESLEAKKIQLYKVQKFPFVWEKVSVLLHGEYVDPSIFNHEGKYWMFVGSRESNHLHLFYSNQITGEWIEHPKSPIIENNYSISRPAGRVIVDKENIYRFTQEGSLHYGELVRSFKIKRLSTLDYEEELIDIILEGSKNLNVWNKDGMHHVDHLRINEDEWIVAVDGINFNRQPYLKWKTRTFLKNPISNCIKAYKTFKQIYLD